MFQLASTIPDKEVLWNSDPKSLIFIENLTRVPIKLEKPETIDFYKIFFQIQH